jgi:signal transduction histidine kinase
LRRRRVKHFGIRIRAAAAFAGGACILSTLLAFLAYEVTRTYLLRQRDTLAVREAVVNAQVVANVLSSPPADPRSIVDRLAGGNAPRPLLQVGGNWYAGAVELGEGQVPRSLRMRVEQGAPARQQAVVNHAPYIVSGVPLPSLGATYYEFAPLTEVRRTLRVVGWTLLAAGATTTLLGASLGWWASRRVLQPLREVSSAARSISRGDLTTRLDVGADPDLAPLVHAFNDMAQAVEDRVNRERRFTADVSHELRTPLTAIVSAVDLARRTELPPRAEMAVELLAEQTTYFRELVLDLLEISRFDAGAALLEPETVDMREMLTRLAGAWGLSPEVIELRLPADRPTFVLDRRRIERVLANLIENATNYGGGVTRIEVRSDGDRLRLAVEDAGPGVDPDERKAVFGRFTRGRAAQRASTAKGTGLGLALVDEHVKLHGGRVHISESRSGGARFEIILPSLADPAANAPVQGRHGVAVR